MDDNTQHTKLSIIRTALSWAYGNRDLIARMSETALLKLFNDGKRIFAEPVIGALLEAFPAGSEVPEWVGTFYKELEEAEYNLARQRAEREDAFQEELNSLSSPETE